jgi:TolA-binding protein
VVVIDACFSGRTGTGAAIVEGLQPLISVRETAGTDKALVFSAGRADEFAGALPGLSRPAFSYLLLGALRGWGDADNNGRVTAHEAVDYTRGALRALVKDRNQTPELSGGSPSDVVGLGKEAGPDLGAMVLASMPARRPASSDVGPTPLGKVGSAPAGTAPVRGTPSMDLNRYLSRTLPGAAEAAAADTQIGRTRRLIEITQEDDPQKPEFQFRLAELYAVKLRHELGLAQKSTLPDQRKEHEASYQRWLLETVKAYIAATKYRKYPRMDEVLYKLGDLLTWAGKNDQAREFFLRLVKDYPASKYVPDAYLSFGEYYFGKGEMDAALKFYQKVEQFPNAPATPYAVYKKGWCHANLRDHKAAVEAFVAVVRMTQEGRGSASADQRLALQNEAKKDIVREYPEIGNPDKAAAFFKRVGGDSWRGMLEALALEYTGRGRPEDAAQARKAVP